MQGSNMTGTDLCVNKPHVLVIFEPPCVCVYIYIYIYIYIYTHTHTHTHTHIQWTLNLKPKNR